MDNNQQRTMTSTQIRNFYSDGMSYMNVKFFNTNLSFTLHPFLSKDNTGRSSYDVKNGQVTTVDFEGAYALYKAGRDIIDGKIEECNMTIPCAAGATLTLERKMGQNGLETIFSITKNNVTIPFRFQTTNIQTKVNGQIVQKTIESGLGAFIKTIEGYLTGINADRHLDKLTDDFIKLQESNGNDKQQNNNNGYRPNNPNKNNGGYRNYNNNGNNYKKPYNNYSNNQNNNWNQNRQNMSSYRVPN